jgi:8-oxo-dGTP pyrophosphatase MutT (NUDIX family)
MTSTREENGKKRPSGGQPLLMAAALVTVSVPPWDSTRFLLMIEQAGGRVWEVPAGRIEPGESGLQAAIRELARKTALRVPPQWCWVMPPWCVPGPQVGDEARTVTIPVHVDLGELDALPAIPSGQGRQRAEWVPAGTYEDLACSLAALHEGGQVFAAHAAVLRDFLGTAW